MGKKIGRNKIFCLKKRYVLYSISDISATLNGLIKTKEYTVTTNYRGVAGFNPPADCTMTISVKGKDCWVSLLDDNILAYEYQDSTLPYAMLKTSSSVTFVLVYLSLS